MNSKILSILTIFSILLQEIRSDVVRYDNFQVYRLTPTTKAGVEYLRNLQHNSQDYRFWSGVLALGQHVDIMVPPNLQDEFNTVLERLEIDAKVYIPNVQKLIDNERSNKSREANFGWNDYYSLEEINDWLLSLVEQYPGKVTIENGGTSYEGRNILGVHVSFSPENRNKAVFLEANIHACEWISSAVVTYILNQILTSEDSRVRAIADSHDWYIFPVFNPDGFAYTHTTDRLWRKTRVPYNETCIGVDPNRNWGYHYNDGGTSDDPCSNNYRGPEAFSEPCTRSLSDYITTIASNLEAYFSFHSYAQILLLPYGYTSDHLDNYDELYEVGLKAIDALAQRYGTQYQLGNVAEILYVASGGSPDWIKGTFNTRITYTYELRDTGEFGMILPAEQIIPTAEETLDSFITIFEEFAKRNPN